MTRGGGDGTEELLRDGGGAYLLPRLIGPMRTKELMMLADDLGGPAAAKERMASFAERRPPAYLGR